MKLMHPMLTRPLELKGEGVPVLVVESPKLFCTWVFEWTGQSEGEEGSWVLTEQDNVLDGGNHLYVVRDYARLPLEDRALQHRFQALVQSLMWEELEQESTQLEQSLQQYLAHLSQLSPVEAGYNQGETLWPLIKAVKYQPVLDGETPLERLMQYLELYHRLMPQPCVILVGLHLYFSSQEVEQLYHIAEGKKWNILVVEPRLKHPLPQERLCIIDENLCEIRVDFPPSVE